MPNISLKRKPDKNKAHYLFPYFYYSEEFIKSHNIVVEPHPIVIKEGEVRRYE